MTGNYPSPNDNTGKHTPVAGATDNPGAQFNAPSSAQLNGVDPQAARESSQRDFTSFMVKFAVIEGLVLATVTLLWVFEVIDDDVFYVLLPAVVILGGGVLSWRILSNTRQNPGISGQGMAPAGNKSSEFGSVPVQTHTQSPSSGQAGADSSVAASSSDSGQFGSGSRVNMFSEGAAPVRPPAPSELSGEIVTLVREGKPIEAIRALREQYPNLGLAEAKQVIDRIPRN